MRLFVLGMDFSYEHGGEETKRAVCDVMTMSMLIRRRARHLTPLLMERCMELS